MSLLLSWRNCQNGSVTEFKFFIFFNTILKACLGSRINYIWLKTSKSSCTTIQRYRPCRLCYRFAVLPIYGISLSSGVLCWACNFNNNRSAPFVRYVLLFQVWIINQLVSFFTPNMSNETNNNNAGKSKMSRELKTLLSNLNEAINNGKESQRSLGRENFLLVSML